MIVLKLLHGEGALTKASFSIAELAIDIVTPVVEATVVEGGQTVPLSTRDGRDVKWLQFIVNTIVHLAYILNKHPILQMACSVNTELALKVVAARVN